MGEAQPIAQAVTGVLTALARASTPSPSSCRTSSADPDAQAARAALTAFRASGFGERHMKRLAAAETDGHVEDGFAMPLPSEGVACRQRAWEALRRDGGCVLLLGPRGTGKTQLACELAYRCARELAVPTQKYHVLAMLLRAERRTFGRREIGPTPCDLAGSARLLVLDDLQDRHDTPWEDRELTLLFDARYASLRRTVLIANWSADQAAQHLPSSLWSRVVETGLVVECTWPSFRRAT